MPQKKKLSGRWKEFVRYMLDKHRGKKNLKEILKTYSKKEYSDFCKKHKAPY